MPEETLGYIELEWTCKYCGAKNPGSVKTCQSCGSAMSEQDTFQVPVAPQLIPDPEALAKAEKGADVHCPFCGARNPAGSLNCTQCGANLTDAKAREKGRVLGAFQQGPSQIPCPFCSTLNPASAVKCSKCNGVLSTPKPAEPSPKPARKIGKAPLVALGGILLLILGICAACGILSLRTTDVMATVQSAQWERSIEITEQRPVQHDDWKDQIPSDAQRGTCTRKFRRTQSQPSGPDSEKVCGTPYVIDQGSGKGKVAQQCEYRVYDDWCTFTRIEWTVVDKAVSRGTDLNPRWPDANLRLGQREGNRSENYEVTFVSGNSRYTYRTGATDFSRYLVGSPWTIKVNTFGAVTEVQSPR